MTRADRKRLLVALCACDRVELCLHHARPQPGVLPFVGAFKRALPWIGFLSRLLPRRSAGTPGRASLFGPLLQVALGFLNRAR